MTQDPFAPRRTPDGSDQRASDEDIIARVVAFLEQRDPENRRERAERHVWLSKHHVLVGPYLARAETSRVMAEAQSSYIHGNFVATLVLALAYAEHVINDALPPLPPKKNGKKEAMTPSLRVVIQQARAAALFPDHLLVGVEILSNFRNALVHRRGSEHKDTLAQRIRNRKAHPRTILEHDARDALVIMYGFFRHSFDPPLQP